MTQGYWAEVPIQSDNQDKTEHLRVKSFAQGPNCGRFELTTWLVAQFFTVWFQQPFIYWFVCLFICLFLHVSPVQNPNKILAKFCDRLCDNEPTT